MSTQIKGIAKCRASNLVHSLWNIITRGLKKKFLIVPKGEKNQITNSIQFQGIRSNSISHFGHYIPMPINRITEKRSSKGTYFTEVLRNTLVKKLKTEFEILLLSNCSQFGLNKSSKKKNNEHESYQISVSNYQYTENKGMLNETLKWSYQNSNWETLADTQFLQEIKCSEREAEREEEERAYRFKRDLLSTNCNVGTLSRSWFIQILF